MAVNTDEAVPIFTPEEDPTTVEEIFSDVPENKAPLQSDEQIDLTANLAAVAQKDIEPDMTFESLVEQNKETIRLGEEVVLRNEAKLRKQRQREEAIEDVAIESLNLGLVDDARAFVDLETSQFLQDLDAIEDVQGYHALEDLAIGALQNDEMLEDPDYGAVQQGLFEQDVGETLDVLKNGAVKTAIFRRELDAYKERLKSQGALGVKPQAGEFAGIFLLPFYDSQGRLNVNENPDTQVRGANKLRIGKLIKTQIEEFANREFESVEQYEASVRDLFQKAEEQSGVFGVNNTITLQILEDYERGTIGGANVVFTDIAGVLDATVVGGVAFKLLGKGAGRLAGLAGMAGARNTSATIDTEAILRTLRKVDTTADDVVEESVQAIDDLIPTALKPTLAGAEDGSIGISGTLAAKLDEINQIGDELETITTQGRLGDRQLQDVVDQKLLKIKERDKNVKVEDYKVVTDPVTKITRVETFIGKKGGGGGFATENAAKGSATRQGFDDSIDIVEDQGRFFIRKTDVVEELGPDGFPLARRPDNSADLIPDSGPVTAGIKSRDLLLPPDLATRSQEAQMAAVRFREQITKPLSKDILRIGKKNLEALNTVMTMGRNERRWFQIDQFAIRWKKTTGKDPTDNDFIAYAAAKKLNDIDFTIHNNHMYTNLARRGAKTVDFKNTATGFDHANTRAFPLEGITGEAAGKLRMLDVEANIVRTGKTDTAAEELADLTQRIDSGNYQVFRLADDIRHEGEAHHFILAPKSSATVKPLARIVLNNVPGGHLMRRTKWFAKQPHIGKYKDGTEFVRGPRTVATYRTQGIAGKNVDEINASLREYREYISGLTPGPSVANARALINVRRTLSEGPFESLDNLERMIKEGRVDAAHDFEAVFDRGLPKFYWEKDIQQSNRINLFADDLGGELDGTLQWLRSSGRDYYGKRTGGLTSPHEDADVVLDPLQSLSKGVEHATKTHAYDHFLNRSVEEWVRVAAPFVGLDELGGSTDARHIFYNGRLSEQLKINNPNLFQKLEENRVLIQRTMGLQTPSQERFSAAKRNIARFVENKVGAKEDGVLAPGLGGRLVMKIDDIQSNNPINAINSMVFDAWLGMLDISQMWVQTQTILTAVAASPKYGGQALSMFFPMQWMRINKSDNLLDYIAKNGKALHGQDPDDFKNMVRQFRASGWNAPGGEVAYLANHSNSIASSGTVHKIQQGRKAGRVFFNEAERWNRQVAFQIAWKETIEKFPKLARDGEEFKALVNKRTNDFSISMTSASNSKIQQGVFSPMTRFMGYQMRLLEAMLPKTYGGNPAFSIAAKRRMAAAQVILYGGKGLPGGQRISDLAQDLYTDATGTEMNALSTKFVESGALDSVLYFVSGGELNTDLAERAGFGRGLDFTFERMGDGSMASPLEFMGGPALSFTSKYAESVKRVMLYFRGTRGPFDLDAQDAKFVLNELVAKHINSLKRAEKGMMIWRLGHVVDPKTGEVMFDATELEGAAAFLGIPLFEETERRVLQEKLVENSDEVREIGSLIAKLDNEAFTAIAEGRTKDAELIMNQNAVIIASYDGDPLLKSQILKFSMSKLGYTPSQWQSLLERTQSRLGSDELPAEEFIRSEE